MNLLEIFQALWGFWPLMFLAALEGTLNRSRKRKLGSNLVHNLLLVWGMFAILWVILAGTGHPARGYFIPQPLNTALFWLIGIGLLAVKGGGWLIDRLRLLRKMRQARDIDNLIELSPSEFERVVAQTYRSFGHRVEIVAAQGDHGIDLVVHSPQGKKYVVQCKRWKGKVGEPVVRDFFGAMQHEKATEGAIVTTGTFTPQARQWAKGKPIRLYDGDEFLKVLHRVQGKSGEQEDFTQEPETPSPAPRPPFCPQCGAPMVLRKARLGFYKDQVFYGCSTFPKCRCIVPLDEA